MSGSERADSAALRALAERGATVFVGHDAANLPDDADTVVHTGHGESTTIGAERAGIEAKAAELRV